MSSSSTRSTSFLAYNTTLQGLVRFACYFMAALTLGAGLAATIQISKQPYIGFVFDSESGQVVQVEDGSPASAAGIRPGDVLLTIDGAPLTTATSYYADKEPGDTVRYDLSRAGVSYRVHLTAASLSVPQWSANLAVAVMGLAFWLLGALVFARRPTEAMSQHFLIFCIWGATAVWVLPLTLTQTLWARYFMYLGLLLSGANFWAFHLYFPRRLNNHSTKLLELGSWLLCATLTSITLLVGPATLVEWSRQMGLSSSFPGSIIRLYFILTVTGGLALLVGSYQVEAGSVRRRVRLIVYGSVIGFSPLLITLIGEVLGGVALPYNLALLGLLATPTVYTISLVRADLMRLEERFYTILVYIVGALLLLALYLLVTTLTTQLFYRTSTHPIPPFLGGITSLLLATLASPIQQGIQRILHRLIYGRHYDYLQVLDRSLHTLSTTLDEDTLLREMAETIPAAIEVSHAGLWVTDTDLLRWVGGTLKPTSSAPLSLAALPEYLQQGRVIQQTLDKAPWLAMSGPVRWWVPLILSGELQGLWVLGTRPNDESFTSIDRRLLQAAARQAALVVKVSRLLRDLRTQLMVSEKAHLEVRQAYTRLVDVREAEQLRIARDLHDSLIQKIYARIVSFDLLKDSARQGQIDEVLQGLERLRQETHQLAVETRSICQSLRPRELQNGLPDSLLVLADEKAEASGLVINVTTPTHLTCEDEVALAIYRIAQESLTNVIKHAQAHKVNVHLIERAETLELVIQDDGRGFDPMEITPQNLGLLGIRERLQALSGSLSIDTSSSQGTTLQVVVPKGVYDGTASAKLFSTLAQSPDLPPG